MTRNISTTNVDKALYKNYLQKASEFKQAMDEAFSSKGWNASALNAIHTGISSNDAILVFKYGIRSSSSKHDDAVKLLRSLIKDERAKTAANHLSKLIFAKNMIEYETRLFKKDEAYSLVNHARKFYEYVNSMLPE